MFGEERRDLVEVPKKVVGGETSSINIRNVCKYHINMYVSITTKLSVSKFMAF